MDELKPDKLIQELQKEIDEADKRSKLNLMTPEMVEERLRSLGAITKTKAELDRMTSDERVEWVMAETNRRIERLSQKLREALELKNGQQKASS